MKILAPNSWKTSWLFFLLFLSASHEFPALFMGETKIADEKRKQVYEAFGFMEKFLEGRKWFCGEDLTIADLAILASLASIIHVGASLNDYPNLKRWYGQCEKDVKGYQENDEGAKIFGEKVKSLLEDKF